MSKRYKQLKIATPKWVAETETKVIRDLYTAALVLSEDTGIQHSVDHYYPLMGKLVSGLHTISNLIIIPHQENMRKKNKHPDVFYQNDLPISVA